ncbi:glutamine amidotransferase [bacterium]|nr:glutamine amidotransferase [bacterium]|tara:strand:- start:1883 stop:2599 length:717 start_codon:yes stop_codon:yes gene_type:complete
MVHHKPLIGITGRRRKGDKLRDSLKVMNHLSFDAYWVDDAQGIIAAGGIPVFLPLSLNSSEIIPLLDGILLSGGADIEPQQYGAEPEPELQEIEPIRDEFELSLLEEVYKRELPVAGICRGLQILNVHAGGTLFQDVPPHSVRNEPASNRVHEVTFDEGSILAGLYGPSMQVNSLHHQSVDRVGNGFLATGLANDLGVEAIEHCELPILAVQWHPEMLDSRDSDPLFQWLVQCSSKRL